MFVMYHAWPNYDKINIAFGNDSQAAYFRQAQNGVYVQMALLASILAK